MMELVEAKLAILRLDNKTLSSFSVLGELWFMVKSECDCDCGRMSVCD